MLHAKQAGLGIRARGEHGATSEPDGNVRDRLLISATPADWALAEWLTLRLTEEGYRVWYDSFCVLGPDWCPRDSETLDRRVCRIIVVLSPVSVPSARSVRERSLVLGLLDKLGTDVLIGIDTGSVGTRELLATAGGGEPIDFAERWDVGFEQLLARLRAADVPRTLPRGSQRAAVARELLRTRRSWPTWL